jgi:hypothetical protein
MESTWGGVVITVIYLPRLQMYAPAGLLGGFSPHPNRARAVRGVPGRPALGRDRLARGSASPECARGAGSL